MAEQRMIFDGHWQTPVRRFPKPMARSAPSTGQVAMGKHVNEHSLNLCVLRRVQRESIKVSPWSHVPHFAFDYSNSYLLRLQQSCTHIQFYTDCYTDSTYTALRGALSSIDSFALGKQSKKFFMLFLKISPLRPAAGRQPSAAALFSLSWCLQKQIPSSS